MALTPEAIAGAVSYYTNQQNTGNKTLQNAVKQVGFAKPAGSSAAVATGAKAAPAPKADPQGSDWSHTLNDLNTKLGWLNPAGMVFGTKWDGKNSFFDAQANEMNVDQGPSGAPKNATQWILNALSTSTYVAGRMQNELGHTTAMHAAEDRQKAQQPGGLNNPLDEVRYWAENIARPIAAGARGVAEGFGARYDGQRPITPGQNLDTIGGMDAIKQGVKGLGGDKNAQNVAAGVGGIAADIITDPTNLIGGTGIIKGIRSGVSAAGDAARAASAAGTKLGLDGAITAGIHGAVDGAKNAEVAAKLTGSQRRAADAEYVATDAARRAAANNIPTTVDKIASEIDTSGKGLVVIPKAADAKVNPLADVPSMSPGAYAEAGKLAPKIGPQTPVSLPSAKIAEGATLAAKNVTEHPQMQAVRDLLPTLGKEGRTVDSAAILGDAKVASTGVAPELVASVTHVLNTAKTVPEITAGLKVLKSTKEGKAILATPIQVAAKDTGGYDPALAGGAPPATLGAALEKAAMRRVTGGTINDAKDPLTRTVMDTLSKLGGSARTTPETFAASLAKNVPNLAPGEIDVPALMGKMAKMNQAQRQELIAQTLNIPTERFTSFDDAIKAATNGQVEASAMRSMLKALGIKSPATKADTLKNILSTRGTMKWDEIQKGIPTAQEVLDNHGIPADVQKAAVTVDVVAERAGVAEEVSTEAATMSPLTKSLSDLGFEKGMAESAIANRNDPRWIEGYGQKLYNTIFQPIVQRASLVANNLTDPATGVQATAAIRAQFMYDHVMQAAEHADKALLAEGRVARFQTAQGFPAFYVPVATVLRNLPEDTVKAAVFNLDHRLTKFGEGYLTDANGLKVQNAKLKVGDSIYSTTIARGAQAAHEGQEPQGILYAMKNDPFIKPKDWAASTDGNRVLIELAANMADPKFVAAMREAHTANQMLAVAEVQKAATDFVNPLASDIIAAAAAGGDRAALMTAVQKASTEAAKLVTPGESSMVADAIGQRLHNGVAATLGEEGVALARADVRSAGGRAPSEILKTQAANAKEAKLRLSIDGQRVPYSAHDRLSLGRNQEVAQELAALRRDSNKAMELDAEALIAQGNYPDTAEGFMLSKIDSEMGLGFMKSFTRPGEQLDGLFGQGSDALSPGRMRIAATAGAHRYAHDYANDLAYWVNGAKFGKKAAPPLGIRLQQALGLAEQPKGEELINQIRNMFAALQVHGAEAAGRGVKLNEDELTAALQAGAPKIPGVSDAAPGMGPEMAQMAVELQAHIDVVMEPIQRLGANTADVMAELAHYGLKDTFVLNPDKALIDQGLNWHSWDTANLADPLETLHRSFQALMASSVRPSIASSVMSIFGHEGMKLSATEAMARGWKYIDPAKSQGLGRYLDKSVLLPPEIIKQLGYVDRAITSLETAAKAGPKLTMALKWYDRALNILKQSMTTYNPSHWATNLLGDAGFNLIEGVDPRHTLRALRVMHAGGGLDADPAALINATHNSGYADAAAAASNSRFVADHIKVMVNGKQIRLSFRQVYEHAVSTGVDITGHIVNDVTDHLGSGMQADAYTRFSRSKINPFSHINKGLDRGSAARDNLTRYPQFIHELEKQNYRSIEEAVQSASGAVHRTHPTNGALAPMERTVARRLVTFYSWQRLALGRIAELAIERPGMVTLPSKFQYEQAQAAGFEPDSIGKPFNNDPRIATYSSNGVYGPTYQGGYSPFGGTGDLPEGTAPHEWGFSLSSPAMDALTSAFQGVTRGTPQEMMKNVDQTIGGNISPLLSTPFDYIRNSNPGGIGKPPQADPGAYFLGKSGAPGRIVKALGLQPKTSATGKLVNTPAQQAGENQRQAVNYATGLKFTDYTNDTSAAFAAKEQGKQKIAQWKNAGYTPEQIKLMQSASR